MHCKLQGRQI